MLICIIAEMSSSDARCPERREEQSDRRKERQEDRRSERREEAVDARDPRYNRRGVRVEGEERPVKRAPHPLCPFCHFYHKKAECGLIMCVDCVSASHRAWNCPRKLCRGCHQLGHIYHCCPGNPTGEFFNPEYLPQIVLGAAPKVETPNVLKIPVPRRGSPAWERAER